MSKKTRRGQFFASTLRLLAMLALILTSAVGAAMPATAQSGTSNVAIVTSENGQYFLDACYVLVNYSQVGCDVNRDGKITFEAIPYGTYTLRQTQSLGGGRYVNDTTITVRGASDSDGWERFYVNVGGGGSSGGSGTSNIAVVTSENGQYFLDACFVLVNYSQVGCDVNRDGKITFEAIPYGTYTLRQTQTLGGGRYVNDTTITVTGAADSDGWERFYVNVVGGGAIGNNQLVDISLITRDPDTGGLLTDVCYVLVGYSNIGCDENNDGQVTFAEIPEGVYTVRQTQTPAGYPTINEFEIEVLDAFGLPRGYLVRQAPEQNAPNTRNVSVVFFDHDTNTRLVSDVCVQLVGASNVGCDSDLKDGQVDFLDVALGTWELDFTNVPAGWVIDPVGSPYGPAPPVTIEAGTGRFTHIQIFVPVSTGNAGQSNPVGSSSQVSEMGPIKLGATSCNAVDCFHDSGVHFTVTELDGTFIDECTNETFPDFPLLSGCEVMVPMDRTVVVTQDIETISPGSVPVENPIYFSWPEPPNIPTPLGVFFSNEYPEGATQPEGLTNAMIEVSANGERAVVTCFELVELETVSCDTDHDGRVPFHNIPVGTYTLRQLEDLQTNTGPGLYVEDRQITLSGEEGFERISIDLTGGSSVPHQPTDSGTGVAPNQAASGTSDFEAMVGDWHGPRRTAPINADGTGMFHYSLMSSGQYIQYQIVIDVGSSPHTATIVEAASSGSGELEGFPAVGDTFTIRMAPPGVLVVELEPGWELTLCSTTVPTNAPGACE